MAGFWFHGHTLADVISMTKGNPGNWLWSNDFSPTLLFSTDVTDEPLHKAIPSDR
jgi:hypothetical protein